MRFTEQEFVDHMTKHLTLIGIVGVACTAILAPIFLSIYIASREATDAEFNRASSYVRDVLRRSEATTDQILNGILKLKALSDENGCEPRSLALMRQIDVASSYIQAIGRVENNQFKCSSLGLAGEQTNLGAVEIKQLDGVQIRTNVQLSFVIGSSFLAVEKDGYAAIIHKDLPIDTALEVPDVALATFSLPTGYILASRGEISPDWLKLGERGAIFRFIQDEHVIVVAPSKRFYLGAVAAFPLSHVNERIRRVIQVTLPIGIATGVVLAAAVLYLVQHQRSLPTVIKAGLRRNEFFLVYQPIVELDSGRWIGAEALLRWNRGGDMITPDQFIPAAEDAGLIQHLTERVVEIAAQDAEGLFCRFPDFYISINLASSDLEDQKTLILLDRLTEATSAKKGNLIVEATERGLADPEKAGPIIRQLRKNGFAIAIDDFGTGFSSLSSLEALELDYLKIDKSFIDTLGRNAVTSSVIPHIIVMANALNIEMIAEGVESEVQADILRKSGVQFAQGWLFGRPMSIHDIIASLEP
ncbi:EAL domain-containing protein (plasmid) [Roseibium aggregatum]|jgi:sensor c-di-GMP phosphodiesterase-like protein|uniref:EAL domain-containing protein n=1 Tax=Roseibium aggregatum TaxID=187304 RepID=UPI001E59AB7B|nr:EAL domain-containing protein [Roseibium aggregatum]UES59866.1 EAL domain-containing protein [Roseibium aggregatum]